MKYGLDPHKKEISTNEALELMAHPLEGVFSKPTGGPDISIAESNYQKLPDHLKELFTERGGNIE